jgi:hypothetical protein
VNEVRISGILGEVKEHDSKAGVFLTARLQFNREHDEILLLAVGARARQLEPFDSGDPIRVIGRLTRFQDGFAVLVDECGAWATANRGRFPYDETKSQRSIREVEQDFPMG